MAKLPVIKPLTGSLLAPLLKPLNQFISDVSSAFNKRLTVTENFDGAILTVTIDGVFPLYVPWTRPNPPIAIWVGSFREVAGPHVIPTVATGIDWEFTDGKVQINAVMGSTATANNNFTLTLVAITG